VARATVS